jgi:hypothetical protein
VTQTNVAQPLHVHTIDPKKGYQTVLWATGGQSGSWQTDFGGKFCGKNYEALAVGYVTQTNVAKPLHVHTIDPKMDIKLCYGQLEANLAHGRQILVPGSVAKFGKCGNICSNSQLLKAM